MILVVEDDTATRDTIIYILESERNYECLGVDNIQDAIKALKNNEITCVLLNYVVGGKTAKDLVLFLRAMPESIRPRVILTTGFNKMEYFKNDPTVNTILKKPFGFYDLLETVDIVCQKNTAKKT